MLAIVYFILFLALSAALLRRQATRYEREHRLAPAPRSGRPRR
jgi:hypothetical protein